MSVNQLRKSQSARHARRSAADDDNIGGHHGVGDVRERFARDRIDGGGPQRIDPVPVAPVSVPRGACRYARPYCAGGCGGRSSGTLGYRDLAHVPGVGSHFLQRGCFLLRATLPGTQTSTWDTQTAHDAIQFLPLRVLLRSSRARAILTATKMTVQIMKSTTRPQSSTN